MIPNGVHELDTSPSCLALNASGTRLYSANETDRAGKGKEGTVSAFAINRTDGQLKLLNTVGSGGAGPTYVSVHPSGRFLLVANYFGGSVAVLPGDGPRHFHFHPNGRWFYSIQEEGSTVVLFDYDAETGRLASRQTISTLPRGFAGSNFCSEVLVSADGRFVYAGNRLHDSIAFFAVGRDGSLTYVGEEWTRGDYPRSFAFDPTGAFLFCCIQRADNVVVFRVCRRPGG